MLPDPPACAMIHRHYRLLPRSLPDPADHKRDQEEESFRLASLTALGTTVVMNYLHTGRYIAD